MLMKLITLLGNDENETIVSQNEMKKMWVKDKRTRWTKNMSQVHSVIKHLFGIAGKAKNAENCSR